jgi:hypothetical protein
MLKIFDKKKNNNNKINTRSKCKRIDSHVHLPGLESG